MKTKLSDLQIEKLLKLLASPEYLLFEPDTLEVYAALLRVAPTKFPNIAKEVNTPILELRHVRSNDSYAIFHYDELQETHIRGQFIGFYTKGADEYFTLELMEYKSVNVEQLIGE